MHKSLPDEPDDALRCAASVEHLAVTEEVFEYERRSPLSLFRGAL